MKCCPVCRARNKGEAICRRCRSDLADIIHIEAQAESAMTKAVWHLQQGNIRQARELCIYSCRLKQTEFGRRFFGFLSELIAG